MSDYIQPPLEDWERVLMEELTHYALPIVFGPKALPPGQTPQHGTCCVIHADGFGLLLTAHHVLEPIVAQFKTDEPSQCIVGNLVQLIPGPRRGMSASAAVDLARILVDEGMLDGLAKAGYRTIRPGYLIGLPAGVDQAIYVVGYPISSYRTLSVGPVARVFTGRPLGLFCRVTSVDVYTGQFKARTHVGALTDPTVNIAAMSGGPAFSFSEVNGIVQPVLHGVLKEGLVHEDGSVSLVFASIEALGPDGQVSTKYLDRDWESAGWRQGTPWFRGER